MLGRGDQIDVVLADRLAEVPRDRVAQGLLAGRADADAGLEHPPWRLAVAEAGHLDLAGDLLERQIDVTIELGLVDLDVQLDFVPLEGFNRRLHEIGNAIGAPLAARQAADRHWGTAPRTCIGRADPAE